MCFFLTNPIACNEEKTKLVVKLYMHILKVFLVMNLQCLRLIITYMCVMCKTCSLLRYSLT